MNIATSTPAARTTLKGLPRYQAEDVRLWNWFNRVFLCGVDWPVLIHSVWTPLLERSAGAEITLIRRSSVSDQEETKSYRFKLEEIRLGRGPENDITLTPRSIAPKHCRILHQGDGYILEDLGSPLGIYLNKRKMKPGECAPLSDGDEFSLFPYRFHFQRSVLWQPESDVRVESSPPVACDFAAFGRRRQLDAAAFELLVYPTNASAYLESSRGFLEQLLTRLLRPFGLTEQAVRSVSAQNGMLEFLILSVLERANAQLRFPFKLELQTARPESRPDPSTPGFELRCSVGLSQLTGCFRLFLPLHAIDAMSSVAQSGADNPTFPAAWPLPIALGSTVFSAAELDQIEAGDMLLFEKHPRLLLPGNADRGWLLSDPAGNNSAFQIDNYFERFSMAETSVAAIETTKPELDDLPVRVDVVLAEKEFTLGELRELAQGSIVEVQRSPEQPVQIKLNGRTAGEGELVEIEGRLGVRILRWRQGQ